MNQELEPQNGMLIDEDVQIVLGELAKLKINGNTSIVIEEWKAIMEYADDLVETTKNPLYVVSLLTRLTNLADKSALLGSFGQTVLFRSALMTDYILGHKLEIWEVFKTS
ncbi:MAG TPA: hypothetical protein VIK81_03530 [Patescibacteria group bacterium]